MKRTFGGLRRSLIAAIVTAMGAMLLALLLLEDPLVEYRLGQIASDTLSDAAQMALGRVGLGESPERVSEELGARFACRITITDLERNVLGDSGLDGDELRNAPLLDSVADFLAERTVPVVQGERYVVFARDGNFIVQASQPSRQDQRVRATFRELLTISGIMAALVAIFLMFVLGRTLVEPTRELTRVANALAEGDLSARTGWTERDDELGVIGRALDRLAEQTRERMAKASQEQDRLRTILDSMTEAVFVTDSLSRIQLTNAALLTMVDGDPVGKTPLEALRSEPLHDAVREVRRTELPSATDIKLDVGGERRYIRAYVAPLAAGPGVVALLHDVTQLQLADIIRRDFVANASHELRTPLTAIRGFAETLRDGALDDRATAERYLDVILRHAKRLEALAKDLTALSRTEAPDQPIDFQPVNVQDVLVDVIDGLKPLAEENGCEIILELESPQTIVSADPKALDQIALNLIENALKYGDQGNVTVRLFVDDARIAFSVHNTGPQISPKHLPRIFERFYRVDPGRSREVGGTGLGLAIVKHLCSQIRAEITVVSPPDEGVTFTVLLEPWSDSVAG